MYEVRFIRTDTAADESYYYQDANDANYHFNLFDDADADLYFAVQLYHTNMLIAQKILGFSDEELRILPEVATKDQFDTCLALLHAAENENDSLCNWVRPYSLNDDEERLISYKYFGLRRDDEGFHLLALLLSVMVK